jgi:hypothetical protein
VFIKLSLHFEKKNATLIEREVSFEVNIARKTGEKEEEAIQTNNPSKKRRREKG